MKRARTHTRTLGLIGVLAGVFALTPSLSAQQIPIYKHPQKAFYASVAECPPIDIQGWFKDPNPLLASHVHMQPQGCIYQIVSSRATFTVPFTVKLHKIGGKITEVSGPQIKSIRWDATGSSTMPDTTGDPMGLKEWTGVATIDPMMLVPGDFLHIWDFPLHGWAGLRFFSRSTLGDGTTRYVDVIATIPVYSMIDPSAPEHKSPEQGNPGVTLRSSVTLWDPRPGGGAPVGELVMEIDDYIPLGPVATPFKLIANAYNYTAPVSLVGTNLFELRKNPDLHHGVPGIIIRSAPAQANRSFFGDFFLNPAEWGSGNQKGMTTWTQTFGNEAVSAVIVFPWSVGAGVPPPLTCQDPTAPNFGGPLPCLPPVVVPIWKTVPGVLQQLDPATIPPQLRFCPAATPTVCQDLIPKP